MDDRSELEQGGAVGTRARRRVFTLEQANRTLPLVARIVGDVAKLHESMSSSKERLASDGLRPGERERLEAAEEDQEQLFDRYIDELAAIGCELKDPGMGLVDFHGRHEGRDVYLCWHLGEEHVDFWHELHTGFAGRQPIATLRESL